MKVDITTAVITAAVGIILSYLLVSTLILKEPNTINVKTLSTSIDPSLSEPSEEVFNYRALNPTVEVYIGCAKYDENGSCVEGTGK